MVADFVKAIESKNSQINAFLYVDKNAKGGSGKLAGKTIAVKANISVLGMPISCASKTLEGYKGSFDADAVSAVKKEGAIIVGITNCDEFACGSSGETSAFGPTNNPSAPGRIPGGSSSGSAAAVAAGMCDMSLGSDTGGSVRNPASHCGVVGIKPTYGLVSRYGLIDMGMSLEGIGPFASNVDDAALLLSVIAGKSVFDGRTHENKIDYSLAPVKKAKIGIISEFEQICSDKRIYKAIMNSADKFASETGSSLVNVKLKHVNLAIQAYYPIVYVEFYSATRKFDGRKYGKKIEESCGEEVLRRILGGKEISRAEYKGLYYRKALGVRQQIRKEMDDAFKKVDFFMSPTTPMLPHKLGEKVTDPKVMYAYDAFTIPANLSGICAGVVPSTKIDDCPVGMQFMAPAFGEKTLLNTMKNFENLKN